MSKLVAIGLLGLFYLLQNKQHNKVRMCNKKLYKNRRTFLTEAREGIDMNFKKLLGGRKYMLGIFLEMIRCCAKVFSSGNFVMTLPWRNREQNKSSLNS